MSTSQIIKICGVVAIVSFLFLPVVGCGNFNATGVDLIKTDEVNFASKLFIVAAMISGLLIALAKAKIQAFYFAIVGIIFLIATYLTTKSTIKPRNSYDMDFSDAIELKSGSYISIIAFVVAAILCKMNSDTINTGKPNDSGQSQFSDS